MLSVGDTKPAIPESIHEWKLARRLGGGSFGEIYLGIHRTTNAQVAVKLESIKAKHPQLLWEAKIYKLLGSAEGLSHVYWYGTEGAYNALVMELLGPSLEELFTSCSRQFTLKTTLLIAQQMLARLEYTHTRSCIHRDVKPDNFLIGRPGTKSEQTIYLIDFGLAKRYVDARGRHIPYREGKSLTGTARYASISTHQGQEQARRDDIEGLAYVLLYFIRGSLPWQGLKIADKRDKYNRIMQKKISTPVDHLCKNLPRELTKLLLYGRNLKFDERPDYVYLQKLIADAWAREGFSRDGILDWSGFMRSFSQKSSRSDTRHMTHKRRVPRVLPASANPKQEEQQPLHLTAVANTVEHGPACRDDANKNNQSHPSGNANAFHATDNLNHQRLCERQKGHDHSYHRIESLRARRSAEEWIRQQTQNPPHAGAPDSNEHRLLNAPGLEEAAPRGPSLAQGRPQTFESSKWAVKGSTGFPKGLPVEFSNAPTATFPAPLLRRHTGESTDAAAFPDHSECLQPGGTLPASPPSLMYRRDRSVEKTRKKTSTNLHRHGKVQYEVNTLANVSAYRQQNWESAQEKGDASNSGLLVVGRQESCLSKEQRSSARRTHVLNIESGGAEGTWRRNMIPPTEAFGRSNHEIPHYSHNPASGLSASRRGDARRATVAANHIGQKTQSESDTSDTNFVFERRHGKLIMQGAGGGSRDNADARILQQPHRRGLGTDYPQNRSKVQNALKLNCTEGLIMTAKQQRPSLPAERLPEACYEGPAI